MERVRILDVATGVHRTYEKETVRADLKEVQQKFGFALSEQEQVEDEILAFEEMDRLPIKTSIGQRSGRSWT